MYIPCSGKFLWNFVCKTKPNFQLLIIFVKGGRIYLLSANKAIGCLMEDKIECLMLLCLGGHQITFTNCLFNTFKVYTEVFILIKGGVLYSLLFGYRIGETVIECYWVNILQVW